MPDCLRVLIVEDSDDDAVLMMNQLESAGFKVEYTRVETAEATESALSTTGWDLVIADYRMPNFSGIEALRMAKDYAGDIPFILVSGTIGEEVAVEALKAGAHDYVMKDNLARLVPAVQRELREAEIRRERKRADEVLHKSEFRFRQIYDSAPVMMHSIDRNGIIRNVNAKWLDEMGYRRDEVLGKTIEYVMAPESRDNLSAMLSRFWADGKISDVSYRYVKKDGTIIDVLLDSVAVHDLVWGEVSLSAVRDVTAQKRAEAALKESEERYRTLIETMNEGFGIQDARGVITYANRKLCEMLQCSQDELIGRPVNNFLDRFEQNVEHLPTMVNDASFEVTWTGKHGRKVATIMSPRPLFDFRGEFMGSCAVITDISGRKKREEEIRGLRHRLELILNSAWEGIVELDLEGRFEFVNPSAANMLGYEIDEIVGRKCHDIWHRSTRDGAPYPEDSCPVYSALTTEPEPYITDEVFWKKNGTSFDVELAVNPVKDGGKTVGTVVTFWDTTARNKARKELQEGKETLEAILHAITESLLLLEKDGHIISVNKAAAQRLQGTVEDLVGRNIYDFVPQELAEERREKDQTVVLSGQAIRYEDSRKDVIFDNHTYPVFGPDGKVTRLVVFSRDVTQQKIAEEALRESEERFRTVFESATDCIFILDGTLRYTHVNPAAEKVFGLPASEVIGRTPADLLPREQAAASAESYKRVMNGEVLEKKHSLTLRGTNFSFHTILVPLRNAAGEVTGVCGISRDISHLQVTEFPSGEQIDHYTSNVMKSTLVAADYAARMDSTVLLLGESGSGKDHLARYIHKQSKRADGPYFSINCAAISSQLAESELFGHERGAFTGAVARKRGLLELAEGGTLLLNEIGELSLPLQSKLLTFLDTRRFTRVGGEKEIFVNARLMAATNKDLEKEADKGTFRKDLFYRLNVMSITVPPLRERREDIPILVRELLSRLRVELQLPNIPTISRECLQALQGYVWPGNIRELRNVLERALILSRGTEINLSTLGFQAVDARPSEDWSFTVSFPSDATVTEIFEDLKRALTDEALRRAGGSKKKAARLLGISRDSFYRYMKSGDQ